MIQKKLPLLVLLVLSLAAITTASLFSAETHKADRWEKEIQKFESQDQSDPPSKGGVVFVGSSSIRMWDLDKSFPDGGFINRGFGGSQTSDSVRYAPRIVVPYEPRTVVLYAGDNDLNAGKSPEQVAKDFRQFVRVVRDELPNTKIVYIAIKPSIARIKMLDRVREANGLIRQYIMENENLAYVDVVSPMLGDEGKPRRDLFIKDGLHLNAKGYELWTSLVAPHLEE